MPRRAERRSKSYIETLEKKVADLEDELKGLHCELSRYKAKEHLYQTGERSGYIQLIQAQEYLKEKGPEIVLKSKDSPKQFISYLSSTYGADGCERRKVIKNAFKVLFDNIIPDIHKIFIFYTNKRKQISKEELAQRIKKLKATKKAATELSEEDRLFYEFITKINLTKEQRRLFKGKTEELEEISLKYKRLIKELITKRREVLNLGKVLKENISAQILMLTTEQILGFIDFFKNFEHSQYLKFHSLWGIRRRNSQEEDKNEDSLTASEIDEDYEHDEVLNEDIYLDVCENDKIKEEAHLRMSTPAVLNLKKDDNLNRM